MKATRVVSLRIHKVFLVAQYESQWTLLVIVIVALITVFIVTIIRKTSEEADSAWLRTNTCTKEYLIRLQKRKRCYNFLVLFVTFRQFRRGIHQCLGTSEHSLDEAVYHVWHLQILVGCFASKQRFNQDIHPSPNQIFADSSLFFLTFVVKFLHFRLIKIIALNKMK